MRVDNLLSMVEWALLSLLLVICPFGTVETNLSKSRTKLTRGICMDHFNFVINPTLSPAGRVRSQVACGIIFVNANNRGELLADNGFSYDEDTKKCVFGYVSFPVEELVTGGVLVYGISKNLPLYSHILLTNHVLTQS